MRRGRRLPLETLVALCRSGDPEQQAFALAQLSEYGDAAALDVVRPLLVSPAWRVRQASVWALEHLPRVAQRDTRCT